MGIGEHQTIGLIDEATALPPHRALGRWHLHLRQAEELPEQRIAHQRFCLHAAIHVEAELVGHHHS